MIELIRVDDTTISVIARTMKDTELLVKTFSNEEMKDLKFTNSGSCRMDFVCPLEDQFKTALLVDILYNEGLLPYDSKIDSYINEESISSSVQEKYLQRFKATLEELEPYKNTPEGKRAIELLSSEVWEPKHYTWAERAVNVYNRYSKYRPEKPLNSWGVKSP